MNRFFIILIATLLLIMSCDSNKLTLTITRYSETGNVNEKYYVDENNLAQGEYISYYDNINQVKEKGNIVDGKFQGEYVMFYENGMLEKRTVLNNNIEIDTTFSYLSNGKINNCSIYDSLGRHLKDVFYLNGNVSYTRAFYIDNLNSEEIAMSKKNNLDGTVNIDESDFCFVDKVSRNSIQIKLLSNIHDSVSVNIVNDFDYEFSFEADVIRTIRLGNVKEFVVEFQDDDYINDTINIQIITEFWENGKLIRQGGNDLQFSEQIDIASDYISPIYR